MSERFRTVARVLRPYVSDVYALTDAADAIVSLPTEAVPVVAPPHDLLVFAALGHDGVMAEVNNNKKINAIKILRGLWSNTGGGSGIGLKAAKEAIEDPRVSGAYNTPWATPSWVDDRDPDEPPF